MEKETEPGSKKQKVADFKKCIVCQKNDPNKKVSKWLFVNIIKMK